MMKVFYSDSKNVGDILAPIIIENLTPNKVQRALSFETGKILVVGSVLEMVREDDIVVGIGSNKPSLFLDSPKGVRYLAVRGPLTKEHIVGAYVPEVYGDPALLLPLIYNPIVKKTRKVGVIPHYVDKPLFKGQDIIDIEDPWHKIVDEILACEEIISSTLHGIVIAEAYGIPARWAVYSNKIEGGEFKYQDYFLGTDREAQEPMKLLPPIKNLKAIQDRLLEALKKI